MDMVLTKAKNYKAAPVLCKVLCLFCILSKAIVTLGQLPEPHQVAAQAMRTGGGFSFNLYFEGGQAVLTRADPSLPGRGQRVVPAYAGKQYGLIAIDTGGTHCATRFGWEYRAEEFALPKSHLVRITVSRLVPAVLIESDASEITFTAGPLESAVFSRIVFPTADKLRHVSCSEEKTISIADAVEPWMLAWFAQTAPLRGYGKPVDVDDPQQGAGFARHPPPPERFDMPILLRWERIPQEVSCGEGKICFRANRPIGKVVLLPLYGGKLIPPQSTQDWIEELPGEVLARCRKFSRLFSSFPLTVEESFRIVDSDTVAIRNRFGLVKLSPTADPAVPLPAALGLVLDTGMPIAILTPDAARAKVVDCELMDVPGKLFMVEGAQEYEVRISGLRQLVDSNRQAGQLPDDPKLRQLLSWLRTELNSHVEQMISSGHLAPLFYVYGGIGGARPAYFYWGSTAELAEAIADAYPYLEPGLQARVVEYLRAENRYRPLLQISVDRYREGANRAPYRIPWQDIGDQMRPALEREYTLRVARRWADLYGIASWYEITQETTPLEGLHEHVQSLLLELTRQQDWALMMPVRPHSPRPAFITGAAYYERNGQAACNGYLAGAIGLARLAERFGWHDHREYALYFAAKLSVARVALAHYTVMLHDMGLVGGKAEDDWRTVVHIDRNCCIVLRGNPKPVVFEDQEIPPFIDLVREVGLLLGRYARRPCQIYLENLDHSMPLWFLSEAPKQSASEHRLCPLQHKSGNVLAQWWILKKRGVDFLRYVDSTRFLGDLYYIRNLAAAIDSITTESSFSESDSVD